MIKVTKENQPLVLEQNQRAWTIDLLTIIQNIEKSTDSNEKRILKKDKAKILKKYGHKAVKEALKNSSTKTKCMYCEGEISLVAHGDIEHFNPKSLYPACTFCWNNLLLSCQICNQIYKKTHDPIQEPILNPSLIDPEKYFCYTDVGKIEVKDKLSSAEKEIAQRTIDILGLDRKEILYAHRKFEPVYRIFENHLQSQLTSLEKEKDEFKREKLIKNLYISFVRIKKQASDEQSYAGYMRYLFKESKIISQIINVLNTNYSTLDTKVNLSF
jgi:uncharacterized protein (TIGR02646 family)